MKKILLLITTVLVLSACTPTLDGSSDEAFQKSYDEVMFDIKTSDERQKFESCVYRVLAAGRQTGKLYAAKKYLHGKTAKQVINDVTNRPDYVKDQILYKK